MLASRAHERSREYIDGEHFGLSRLRNGEEKHGEDALLTLFPPSARAVFYSKMLEGPAWEALSPCALDTLHMRVTAKEFNDTKKHDTGAEVFFSF